MQWNIDGCPIITGAAASLLSQNPDIYKMPRNRARLDAIEQLLFNNCTTRGFGPRFEGHGMPDLGKV
jgi:minor extracellular protease Epr